MVVTTTGADDRRRPAPLGAVVSDLDGTLLRSDGSLSRATARLLPTVADMGIPFVVATARTPRAIRKIGGHDGLGRVVCANGAVLWGRPKRPGHPGEVFRSGRARRRGDRRFGGAARSRHRPAVGRNHVPRRHLRDSPA